jgi:hypothetical protein
MYRFERAFKSQTMDTETKEYLMKKHQWQNWYALCDFEAKGDDEDVTYLVGTWRNGKPFYLFSFRTKNHGQEPKKIISR